jgi:hypothetical protein
MPKYTPAELQKRDAIIQTHRLFGDVLDADMINSLVYLFDKKRINNKDTIRQYIEEERMKRGINDTDKTTNSEIYDHTRNTATLHIDINKNNMKLIHFTIHLTLHTLHPKDNGMIHFSKDIYRISYKKQFYALVAVVRPQGKPHSLEFYIPEEFQTTPDAPNSSIYDMEVQQEMDIIITVMNHLFDEKHKYYIGNILHPSSDELKNIYPYYKNTNTVLNDINMYSKIKTRRNTGKYPLPPRQNQYPNMTYPIIRRTITKKNKRRTTRKIQK